MGWAGIVLVVLALVVGLKVYQKAGLEKQALGTVAPMVEELPGYAEKGEVIDTMFEKAHEVAFKITARVGWVPGSARFDETKYVAIVFGVIHQLAEREGRADIEDAVETLITERGIQPTEVSNLDEALGE